MNELLERASRAVATANGYHYSGDSILENAEANPRSEHFVAIAQAVIDAAGVAKMQAEMRRVADELGRRGLVDLADDLRMASK